MKPFLSSARKLYFLVGLMLVLVNTHILAQNTGELHGRVTTVAGSPLAFITVTLIERNQKTSTSESGSFSFRSVVSGNYTLSFSGLGLRAYQQNITIRSGETTNIDVVLTEQTAALNEVIIRDGKTLNEKPISIGKIALNPMDLPQSIQIIDKNIMDKQQVLRLSDALKNSNGVYLMGTTGGTQEEIAGRGFAFGSNNTFKNGARFNNGVMPETSALEQIEVLKGSAAILFGAVAPGGVLNLVTKKPRFDTGGEIAVRWGSYDFYKPTLDVYGALNESEKIAYRLNATYETANSFRKLVNSERIYANPSLLYKFNNKTQILLEADYLKDNRTPDFGVGAINYQISSLARSTFIGAHWATYETIQKGLTATLSHQLNTRWNLRAMYTTQSYLNNQYSTSRPTNIQANGNWTRALQRSRSDERYGLAQLDITGETFTGKLKHQVLIGADFDRYHTETPTFAILYNPSNASQSTYDTINIYNLNLYTQRTDVPAVSTTKLTTSPVNRLGFYLQDLLSFTKHWKALLGIRFSYLDTRSQVYTLATQTTEAAKARYNHAVTPRFGLVYQPSNAVSIFASYANSFNLNTGISSDGAPLNPSFVNQYELGLKNELFRGLLSANITAYQIVNSNLSQTILPGASNYNAAYPTAQELAGEVTSKGLELDLMSKNIHGFTLSGGYSYNDTRYTKSTIYEIGSKLRYNPSHTANLGIHYAFTNGLEAGCNMQYFGRRFAGRNTRLTVQNDAYRLIPLKAFNQVDLTLGYRVKKLSFRMKVSNVLNEMNYFAHDDNSINPIAPSQFSSTLSYTF